MTVLRQTTPLDHLLTEAQRALDTVFGNPPAARPYPAAGTGEPGMGRAERRHAAGLMRINHVGEVCAQGLYFGQAAVAREPETVSLLQTHLAELRQLLGRDGLQTGQIDIFMAGQQASGSGSQQPRGQRLTQPAAVTVRKIGAKQLGQLISYGMERRPGSSEINYYV